MKTLIIGAGEVGKSLYHVLQEGHEAYIRDIEDLALEGVEVLNICFPYFEGFETAVQKYQEHYQPKLTIIHSTVKPGTSRRLGAVHSPIHGKHPNLEGGIKTFIKYIGGVDQKSVILAQEFLGAAGIETKIVSSPEASELSKILCTTYYGWNIIFNKEVKRICDTFGVDFDEVYGWSEFYNEGYRQLGMPEFIRPVLRHTEGQIGGHCVIPNCYLLPEEDITKFILKKNEEYGS